MMINNNETKDFHPGEMISQTVVAASQVIGLILLHDSKE